MYRIATYALAATLSMPLASSANARCEREPAHQQIIEVRDTQYRLALSGNPLKSAFLIPNYHIRANFILDQHSLAQLIEQKKISAVALEGLEARVPPYSASDLDLDPRLVSEINSANTLVLGIENKGIRTQAIDLAVAYFKGQAANAYTRRAMLLGSLDPFNAKNFVAQFSSTIGNYLKDIEAFRKANPDVPVNVQSYSRLVKDAREDAALEVITKHPSVGVIFGEDHIPNFIEKLCATDYTVYVAIQRPIVVHTAETPEDDLIPDTLKEVLAVLNDIELFARLQETK